MKIIHKLSELQDFLTDNAYANRKIILVPTMGALHAGHLALVAKAKKLAGDDGLVILTLFVNPTQFDRAEDLTNYPRTFDEDVRKSQISGVDLLFAPESRNMYHADHSVTVTESLLSKHLCGATRSGHFDGVCTVVLKLFMLTRATDALFGKKDYQQLAIIRRMVRDLNIPIKIHGVDTVREPNGLAMSSRNERLSSEQKNDAARIHEALELSKNTYLEGETRTQALIEIAKQYILKSALHPKIDYLDILDAETLQQIQEVKQPAILATAVFYDKVRLIDNVELSNS